MNLQGFGINRVYVDVWNQGTVYFNSPTMQGFSPSSQGRDILSWAVSAGRSTNIEVYAWFEYGLMASYGSLNNAFAQQAQQKGWILGQYNNFYYMDPTSGATEFLGRLMNDAGAYGVGVQLDDHFACPTTFSVCSTEVMLQAAKTVFSASSARHSLAPMPYPDCVRDYAADWKQWLEYGYFGETIPQFYYTSASTFENSVDYNVQEIGYTIADKMSCGIRVNGSGSPTAWNEVEGMLNYADQNGYGSVIWYADGIIGVYPNQFKQYWSAQF